MFYLVFWLKRLYSWDRHCKLVAAMTLVDMFSLGTSVSTILGIVFAVWMLRTIHKTIEFSKIETYVKLEAELNRATENLVKIYYEHGKSSDKEQIYVEAHKTYNNVLDRICFFVLNSGSRFKKKMKPQLYPLLSRRVEKDKSIKMERDFWINIQALYDLWS